MLSKCIPHARLQGESVDAYCRRRKRNSRQKAYEVGTWSKIWCKRALAWNHHLGRAREPDRSPHICNNLLDFHSSKWLVMQRSAWVSSNARTHNPRNSLWAGRTGTRLNIGRPQVRWKDGVSYAKSMCEQPSLGVFGHALTVCNLYRRAQGLVRSTATYFHSDAG